LTTWIDGEYGNLFFLMDQQNRVQGVYRDEGEFAMRKLAFDALNLLRGDSQTTAEVAVKELSPQAGERLFNSLDCAHCHSPTGPADTTGLSFEAITAADRHLGVCKPPVAAGRGTGDHIFDIVPGHPEDSILPFRMGSREPGVMMPEQGRSTVHLEGLALIRNWIAAMPGQCGV